MRPTRPIRLRKSILVIRVRPFLKLEINRLRLATFVVFYYFEDYTYNMIASLDFYIE